MLTKEQEILQVVFEYYSAASLSHGDFLTLLKYCNGAENVVELGTNTGTTAILLSQMCKSVTTIDIFEDIASIDNEEQRIFYSRGFESNRHYYKSIKDKLARFKNVDVIKSLSYEAISQFEDESIDRIFIDADHSYEGVKRDYEAWFNKVKPGGLFLFHDIIENCHIDSNLAGVYKYYVNELQKDKRIVEIVENDIIPFSSIRIFIKESQK